MVKGDIISAQENSQKLVLRAIEKGHEARVEGEQEPEVPVMSKTNVPSTPMENNQKALPTRSLQPMGNGKPRLQTKGQRTIQNLPTMSLQDRSISRAWA